jgi:hypothetical protein
MIAERVNSCETPRAVRVLADEVPVFAMVYKVLVEFGARREHFCATFDRAGTSWLGDVGRVCLWQRCGISKNFTVLGVFWLFWLLQSVIEQASTVKILLMGSTGSGTGGTGVEFVAWQMKSRR